jgi:enoyl-CoA hydratase/carnithine racemase
MAECLVQSSDEGVVRLTLNRPQRRNALSDELLSRLEEAIHAIGLSPRVQVVVLGANGPVFSAGHDLAEMAKLGESERRALFERCARVMQGLRRLPQPVIARVQGLATAAGCQIVASCDLAVAAEEAAFATPGVKIGLFCTTPMIPLVRVVPPRVALEMLMTGAPISARRALEVGLVNRVVPTAQLDAAVQELADSLRAFSPRVLAEGKRAFYELAGLDETEAYARATERMVSCAGSDDAREGIAAFLEKRDAAWARADS